MAPIQITHTMDIRQIKAFLSDTDSQQRLKAITELRDYEAEVSVPLLLSAMKDPEFLVRSFVAMGLGKKHTAESFAALLEMMKCDRDSNVRAEAANSLSYFGEMSASHLMLAFYQDDHWLVRRSILAALMELNRPEELFEVCVWGIVGEDLTVQEASVEALGSLVGTPKQDVALDQLLTKVDDPSWRVRVQVAKALGKFVTAQAKAALEKLREDEDHRVVGAVLESTMS